MSTIYIIDDDDLMAECFATACRRAAPDAKIKIFPDALAAVQSIDDDAPCLIFLDILLIGPDGFTFLHELASYQDTAQIPIVVVSSLDFHDQDLSPYGVIATLNKATLRPQELERYVQRFAH